MFCKLCRSESLQKMDEGVRDFEYGAPGAYSYWRCLDCNLLSVDPVPDDRTLDLAYPKSYHAYHEHNMVLARYMKRRYWSRKARDLSRFVTGSSPILDAGCASGDLLMELKKLGIENTVGIDFNVDVINRAKNRGLVVQRGELETLPLPKGTFQMVVMDNFIEHVMDPVRTLNRCRELLLPGGIVAGETPNWDSLDHNLFRRYWGGYHTPRHIFIFDRNSIKTLAKTSGFEVVVIKNILQPAHWALSLQNLVQSSRYRSDLTNGRGPYFALSLALSLPLNFIQAMISRTSLMQFVLRRA